MPDSPASSIGAVDRGDALQRRLQAADGDRAADQPVGLRRRWRSVAQRPVFALQLRALQAAPHRVEDLREPEGFEDGVARAGAQRLDGGVEVGEGGDEDHLAGVPALAQLAQPGDAALAGQGDVEHQQVEAMVPDQLVAGFGIGGAVHPPQRLARVFEEVARMPASSSTTSGRAAIRAGSGWRGMAGGRGQRHYVA